jgi:DNA-binding GntR family transcriptional regulator
MTTSSDAADGALALILPQLANRRSLRELIAESLRASLVAGQMRPGVVFSAPALAERFGVSATPVREAMIDLAREGLMEPIRNKGFRVTELSDKDLDDITQLRALIEVPTVVQLALVAPVKELQALRPIAHAIVESAAAGDLIAFVEADRRFHLGLLALSGNPRLVVAVRDLRALTRLYGLDQLVRDGRLTASAEEHLELLDALVARDPCATETIMRRHIGHVRGLYAVVPEA